VKAFFSRRRAVATAVLFLLVLLFLFRPGASRLKSRITLSISAAVGRSVDIGSVHLRLLPRPGFDLENLVVYDDPAFGAEPMLRAGEVTADLRLTSLVRGRLEIARLDLTDPSLNLVHGANGRWNLEALLERTAHTPLAPTGKAKLEPRPGFPYIAATGARINFKSGAEKKPYALTNAEFSLWQDSENAWGVRLKAQPFRTDLNLNDTGTLQVDGTWQRAESLRDTPLQLNIEWNRAQLGQLTKFFTGSDKGWRGDVLLDVTLLGSPGNLQIASNVSIQDFRRYDIQTGSALRLAGHCDGQFSSINQQFHEVVCTAPVGNGLIALKGNAGLPGSGTYQLVLMAENLPASAAMALAQRAKNNLPQDLVATGTISGDFSFERDASKAHARFEGRGEVSEFRLASETYKAEVGPETIPFTLIGGDSPGRSAKHSQRKSAPGMHDPQGPYLEFGPFPLAYPAAGHAASATVRGWVSPAGCDFSVIGETEVGRTLRAARLFGIPSQQAAVEGSALVDLQIAGSWAGNGSGRAAGFASPQVTGTAKLRNLRVEVRGAGGGVQIASADLRLSADQVRVEKLIATAAETSWTGSLSLPRGCGSPGACQIHFDLKADQIGLTGLSEWVSPTAKQRPWYRVLESSARVGAPFLASVHASGHITADQLLVRDFEASHVSADVSLDAGKLQVSEWNVDFWGGKHRGEWHADFTVKPAMCGGSGSFTGISLERIADTMKDQWIAGTANASYEIKGICPADFWTSAVAMLQFDIKDGVLPHISLAGDDEPLKVSRFSGRARIDGGQIEIKDAKLDSASGKFLLSGTASLKQELDLKLVAEPNGSQTAGFTITGTLAQPRVVRSAAETQAQLKR
jgi:AsmA family/AsmA-like C-terminal region